LTRSRVASTVILIVGLASLFFYLRGRPTDTPRAPQATGPQELVATVRSSLAASTGSWPEIALESGVAPAARQARAHQSRDAGGRASPRRTLSSSAGRTIWTLRCAGCRVFGRTAFTSAMCSSRSRPLRSEGGQSSCRQPHDSTGNPRGGCPDDTAWSSRFRHPSAGRAVARQPRGAAASQTPPALTAGTLAEAWGSRRIGRHGGSRPFVLREYRPGDRLVFAATALLRKDERDVNCRTLTARARDRPDQMPRCCGSRRQADLTPRGSSGRPRGHQESCGRRRFASTTSAWPRPHFLWFNLTTRSGVHTRRSPGCSSASFAPPFACRRSRAFANTVYLGGGIPVSGPVTTGNRACTTRRFPGSLRPARARALLAEVGLRDRDGNGVSTRRRRARRFRPADTEGQHPARTERAFIQEISKGGLVVDVVTLEQRQ